MPGLSIAGNMIFVYLTSCAVNHEVIFIPKITNNQIEKKPVILLLEYVKQSNN